MTIEKKVTTHCSTEELTAIKGFMEFLDDMDDDVYDELVSNGIVSKDFYEETASLYTFMKTGEFFV